MMMLFLHILWRDIRQLLGVAGGLCVQLGFLAVTTSLFSFALGAKQALLQEISVAIMWVALLLGSLLSLSRLFEEDFEDGSLQLMWMQAIPGELVVLAKFLAHYISNLLPLMLLVPLLAQMLFMPPAQIYAIIWVLPLVMLLLTLIGGMGAALTLGVKRATGLMGLLVFPLYIPVLIFAVSAVTGEGEIQQTSIGMLVAFVALILPIAPFLSSFAVQKHLENA